MNEKLNRTIEQEWNLLKDLSIPKDAPDIQLQEMKRAFFAGAYMALMKVSAMGRHDVSEKEAIALMQRLVSECETFKALVLIDKA